MYKFIWKGIIRDKSRSLLPIIVVAIGVFFVVFLNGLTSGMMYNMIKMTAHFQTGHLKVITRAYHEQEEQKPNDLALLGVDELLEKLNGDFPEVEWTPRIFFSGLLDIPDDKGETKAQGPALGTAYDLLGGGSREAERIGLEKALVSGHLIQKPNEVILSNDFAQLYDVKPGDTLTFFGSTMYGSMSFANYTVAGIARFGVGQLDRGAVIVDIMDARQLLDMDNAASELFGFLSHNEYDRAEAERIKTLFNQQYAGGTDEYAPVMFQLADQNFMSQTINYIDSVTYVMIVLLIIASSIVLWNTGILGSIRRYNEFGVRLALGEEKGHLYRTLLAESLLIGVIGSILGTALGIGSSYLLKVYGLDYSRIMENVNMMMDPVIRSEIVPQMYFIGFIPGILSTLIGTALAGMAIYQRKTAMLFKELE